MAHEQQPPRGRRPQPPLTHDALRTLALRYVGRYATSSGKLLSYLTRKIRERGWEDGSTPGLDVLIEDFVRLGYINDADFAAARKGALLRRGFGSSRIRSTLRHSGVGEALAESESTIDEETARQSALDFARRKRIGPYGIELGDRKARDKAFAAMVRAGHDYTTIREILGRQAENFTE